MSFALSYRLVNNICMKRVCSVSAFRSLPVRASFSCNALKGVEKKQTQLSVPKLQFSTSAVLKSDEKVHDHRGLWTAEKVLSAALVGLIPGCVFYPGPGMEYLAAIAIVAHIHWGIEGIVVDYVRPVMFGNTIPKLSVYAIYVISALTLGALYSFIYTDVGLVNAVKLLWKL